MRSRLFVGFVTHRRREPIRHAFRSPAALLALDLAELPELGRSWWFGHNRSRLLAVWDRDYVDATPGTIQEKLIRCLSERLPAEQVERIDRTTLLTMPRLLGHAFNPVNFYLCHGAEDGLVAAAAEVRNTFGERHLYLLDPQDAAPGRFSAEKRLYVSPFFDLAGIYRFTLDVSEDRIAIAVRLDRPGERPFDASLWGQTLPWSTAGFAQWLLRRPLTPIWTLPRIYFQAGRLYYQRGLAVQPHPGPTSPPTRARRPNLVDRAAAAFAFRFLSSMRRGRLAIELPSGTRRVFGEEAGTPSVTLRVHDPAFFRRVVLHGEIGFGESYSAGQWDADDLPGLLRLILLNRELAEDRRLALPIVTRWKHWLDHKRRGNTLFRSARNVRSHYDLSNDLFAAFLDETMMYSCALFRSPEESLEGAQRNKIAAIIEKARLRAGDRVLEIGCGWGAFAIEAARRVGCRVLGITLSRRQLDFARARARELGVEDRVEFALCDYRRVQGTFDKIVSIEMLEAVGHEHYPSFFRACERVLAPDGLVVLQFISIPDVRYRAYRAGSDWIQKHIFPGGHLPSLSALTAAMARHSGLAVEHLENIGLHYARTLREWRERFRGAAERLQGLGFDHAFRRTWEFYFAYCEAAFATHHLSDLQVVLSRPNNRLLIQEAAGP